MGVTGSSPVTSIPQKAASHIALGWPSSTPAAPGIIALNDSRPSADRYLLVLHRQRVSGGEAVALSSARPLARSKVDREQRPIASGGLGQRFREQTPWQTFMIWPTLLNDIGQFRGCSITIISKYQSDRSLPDRQYSSARPQNSVDKQPFSLYIGMLSRLRRCS